MNVQNHYFLLIFCLLIVLSCSQENTSKTSSISADDIQLFSEISDKTGITFSNTLEEKIERMWYNFNPVYDGAGVALGDINNDGLTDIYFTGNEVDNALYLNKGDFQFEDITSKANVAGGKGWTNGATMVDINNDGWLDIYICRGGWVKDKNLRKNILYINQKDGSFKNEAKAYGLEGSGYSFQSLFLDYDGDGDLDVYVINHPSKSNIDIPDYNEGRKRGDYDCKDKLFRNDGNQHFTDVTKEAGLFENYGFGLSACSADLDGNGYPDIYVSNDYTEPDYLFLNNGDGSFTESIKDRTKHIPLFSMGTDISDFNNDGHEDIFVSEMLPKDYKRSKTMMANMNPERFEKIVSEGFHHQYMHNALQLNQGNGYFSEVSQMGGISKTGWSWACFISDFDNDGLRDAFISNGYKRDVYDKDSAKKRQKYLKDNNQRIKDLDKFLEITPVTKTANFFYHNTDGYHFEDKSSKWGFEKKSFSNGASIADLDNDGDLDIVTNNFDEPAFVYRNNADKLNNHHVRIKLKGPQGNPHGIGAKITLIQGEHQYFEEFKMTRGYLSSVEPIAHFGVGKAKKIDKVLVRWHDGKESSLSNVETNQLIDIDYQSAQSKSSQPKNQATLFKDITQQTLPQNFKHVENEHDDYRYQVLLPHRLSELGPHASAADINQDGLMDVFIGGSKGTAATLLIQNKNNQFIPKKVTAFDKDANYEDIESVFLDVDKDGDMDLYVVSGGTEELRDHELYIDRLYLNDGKGNFERSTNRVPNIPISGSCVLAHDYDKDNDLDLFVGGRIIPEVYPAPVHSVLLENQNGAFPLVNDKKAKELFNLGMVTDAVWVDLDGDTWDELVVVGEWMPVTIFKNNQGILEKSTAYPNLQHTTGWWNTIEAKDLDQDGDIDFVLGNLGNNYKFKASKEKPFHIYANDFDNNGSFDPFLVKEYEGDQVPIRGKQCTSEQVPGISDKFPSYHEFAEADIFNIIGAEIEQSLHYEAKEFKSIILRNNNGQLDIEYLPVLSQISTINGIVIDDFNKDNILDILVAGNMYQSEAETSRADASFGLLLEGTKNNNFKAVNAQESGIHLPYDVKSLKSLTLANQQKAILVNSNDDYFRVLRY